jgi:hypothetical protein
MQQGVSNTYHPQMNPFVPMNSSGALVPSATPANPYALNAPGGVANQPPQHPPSFGQQPFQQPVMQQQQPFGQPQQQQMVHVGAGNAWTVAPGGVNPMMVSL